MAGLPAGEPWIRLGISAAVFAAMAGWEVMVPRHSQAIGRWVRWPNNLGVVIIDTILLRLLFPAAAVGEALGGEPQGWGLLNNLRLAPWIAVIMAVICSISRSIFSTYCFMPCNSMPRPGRGPILDELAAPRLDRDLDIGESGRREPVFDLARGGGTREACAKQCRVRGEFGRKRSGIDDVAR